MSDSRSRNWPSGIMERSRYRCGLGNPSSGARVSSKAIHDKTPYAQPDSQQSVSLSFEVQIPGRRDARYRNRCILDFQYLRVRK